VLFARFRRATVSLTLVFSLFVAMTLTSVIVSQGVIDLSSRKLLLLAQFLLPVSALALGEMFESEAASDDPWSRALLYTLAVFVPLQLAATWLQGKYMLTHDLWIFSIYQHRQYVPVVFVAAYLVPLFALCDSRRERVLLVGLSPLMGIYVAISYSTLALGLLLLGVALVAWRARGCSLRFAIAALVIASMATALWEVRDTPDFRQKYTLEESASAIPGTPVLMPDNVSSRARDWALYGRGILESRETLLFGHRQALERSVSTSAHNYYLDWVYNFGVVALLPLVALVIYTLRLLLRERRVWGDLDTCGLAVIVLFLIFIDNNLKVTFRQPYPGIFAFFLWGVLLARLRGRSMTVR